MQCTKARSCRYRRISNWSWAVSPRNGGPYTTPEIRYDRSHALEAERVFEVLDVPAADDDGEPEEQGAGRDDLRGERGIFTRGETLHPMEDSSQIEDRRVETQQHQRPKLEPEGNVGRVIRWHANDRHIPRDDVHAEPDHRERKEPM